MKKLSDILDGSKIAHDLSYFKFRSLITESGCWIWQGANNGKYGVFATHRGGNYYTHRATYEIKFGPISDGLVADHKCEVYLCCNPDHIIPATYLENSARWQSHITHCPRGHLLTTRIRPGFNRTRRHCPICNNIRRRAHLMGMDIDRYIKIYIEGSIRA